MSDYYEFCPNCDANLTLQRGYDNNLPYWVCLGCGQMLINPDMDNESDIIWRCDKCGALLNIQEGFDEESEVFVCRKCGFENKLDESNLYESEDERIMDSNNPYKGLSDDAILELSQYKDIRVISDKGNVVLIEDIEKGHLYIKKFLETYDKSIYEYLMNNPIKGMPRIISLYESNNCLIVIEEYILGKTLEEYLEDGCMSMELALDVAKKLCVILNVLHNLNRPIIHRDIKPSNVILCENGDVYLLDVNVAKWYESDKCNDTRYLGTMNFAAPEQVGYGFTSSSEKSDIYALGVLINVLITGAFPKEKRVEGALWPVIEKCMSLEADKRYTAMELLKTLEEIEHFE